MRLEDPRWSLPESVDIPPAELAAQLRLPVEVVEAYPIVGRFGLLAKCLDRLSVADEDAEKHLRMLDTWLGTYSDGAGREFEVMPTGSRGAFRGWLLDRFDLLGRYGYAARVADEDDDGLDGLAHSYDDGRRPDMVARITDDGDAVARGTGSSSSTRPPPSATMPTTSSPCSSTGCATSSATGWATPRYTDC